MTNKTLKINTNDLEEALYSIDRTLNTKADGSNWTVADSLSNIAFQLERIANALEKK